MTQPSAVQSVARTGAAPNGSPAPARELPQDRFHRVLQGVSDGTGRDPQVQTDDPDARTEDQDKRAGDADTQAGDPAWLPLAAFIADAMKEENAPASSRGPAGEGGKPVVLPASQGLQAQAALPGQCLPSGSAGVPVPAEGAASATSAATRQAIATLAMQAGSAAAQATDGLDIIPADASTLPANAAHAVLGVQGGAQAATPAAPLVHQQPIATPMHSPRWAEELGQRVALMAVRGAHSGSLSLVPEQMGPIEVRIRMHQDTANVWFGASQADTRAALQDALPRLREMFATNGLSLGEAEVSQQSPRREDESAPPHRSYLPEREAVVAVGLPRHVSVPGRLDLYA